MSFTAEVKKELIACEIKKTCCRKALLYGLLYNSVYTDGGFLLAVNNMDAATLASSLMKNILHTDGTLIKESMAGRAVYRIEFASKSLALAFDMLENNPEVMIPDAVGFHCGECFGCFLRGVFIACASVNDPQKGYHLEYALARENITRASKLYRFMSDVGFVPHISNRGNFCGLYFKSNQNISDMLYYTGAAVQSFNFANVCIMRDIRNNENRATNCVAKNISKSVGASVRHITAINALISAHKLEVLPAELRETAKLRSENEGASLSELALMHNPPISKSGLNHRLEKICDAAEELCAH